ncbi:hypothetical protein [Agrococcus sp. DT81.2]|uniref:VG15 protein n=1 Tax=Agrococcus sp. DT81.2 TaxID=3393414 RepID=UPI003CE4FC17
MREMWAELDPVRIQSTRDRWLAASLIGAVAYHDASAELAADYVASYRLAEAEGVTGPIVRPVVDRARVVTSLSLTGPAALYLEQQAGLDPVEAHRKAGNKVAGAYRRHVQQGGRSLVDLTARADRSVVGWRRVTDGSPCAFCAMLATRGPVYGSESSARSSTNGSRYHDRCGCSAELVYGEWQPNETEQRWIDDYQAAAEEATATEGVRRAPYSRDGVRHDEDTILHRLREQGYR